MTPISSRRCTRRAHCDADRWTISANATLVMRPSRCSAARMRRSKKSSPGMRGLLIKSQVYTIITHILCRRSALCAETAHAAHYLQSLGVIGAGGEEMTAERRDLWDNPQWDNPMGTDGFEFVEYTAPDPAALGAVFERMGFSAVARHRSKRVTLYRQGDVNFIVNAEPDSLDRKSTRLNSSHSSISYA